MRILTNHSPRDSHDHSPAAEQHVQEGGLREITGKQLLDTFRTNIFSMFYLTKAALTYLNEDDAIINSTSVTAYRVEAEMIAGGPRSASAAARGLKK